MRRSFGSCPRPPECCTLRFATDASVILRLVHYPAVSLRLARFPTKMADEDVWLPTVVTLFNIAANLIAFYKYEERLVRINTAKIALGNVLASWQSLEDGDQIKHAKVNRCVTDTENIIEALEIGGLESMMQQQGQNGDKDKNH